MSNPSGFLVYFVPMCSIQAASSSSDAPGAAASGATVSGWSLQPAKSKPVNVIAANLFIPTPPWDCVPSYNDVQKVSTLRGWVQNGTLTWEARARLTNDHYRRVATS